MAIAEDLVLKLRDSIRDGSFPDSDELLTANLTIDTVPSLLAAIANGRDSLSNEIRQISQGQAGDVDEWIAQAEKVQDDIAKCKIEARQIVEEHERVESMRQAVREASGKVQLLEAEIVFTRTIEHELQSVGEISQVLDEAGQHLVQNDPTSSVEKLGSVRKTITSLSAGRTRSLLLQLEDDLRRKSRSQLQEALDGRWVVSQNEEGISLEVVNNSADGAREEDIADLQTGRILHALDDLDALPDSIALLLRKLEAFILPLLSSKSSKQPSLVQVSEHKLNVTFTSTRPESETVVVNMKVMAEFLYIHLPETIRSEVVKQLLPKIISSLISNWLDTAVPYELDDLPNIEKLQQHVLDFTTTLAQYSWPGTLQLKKWVDSIPEIWLTKRHMRSIDTVRKSFTITQTQTRQVERIERQIVSKHEAAGVTGQDVANDWNAAWDDKSSTKQTKDTTSVDEEDASGWDLEIEDQPGSEPQDEPGSTDEVEDDSGDAWGWGDESPTEAKKETKLDTATQANGPLKTSPTEKEMVLTELYTITNIPDYVLEIIGRDLIDSQTIQQNPGTYFKSNDAGSELQSSPILILAMFRATAPTYYSHSSSLTSMHLYNDALYIVQTLQNNPDKALQPSLKSSINSMSKFARQTYTRELDVQRTILSDLLDGAQGFESCTELPYSRECKNAIDGVIDRIRTVHLEWRDILGQSHLMQSIGSLVTMVMQKIIRDIEDMEDITEAQGRQLIEYCQSISSLDLLFIVTPPSSSSPTTPDPTLDQEPVSTVALYVPNYFRFQYLTQILESNLVEINYLWKEGELHLEFSADEVVDLIKALFSESQKRREAIYEIKRSSSRMR
jgi:centromere/kinetochore protein ZW10